MFYKNGKDHIGTMLGELEAWMNRYGYGKLDDFRGRMSQEKSRNPAVYERVQFMKHFGGGREITRAFRIIYLIGRISVISCVMSSW